MLLQVRHEHCRFFADVGGHDVAVLIANLFEVVANVFHGQVGVEITGGLANEDTCNTATTNAVHLAAYWAIFVRQESNDW